MAMNEILSEQQTGIQILSIDFFQITTPYIPKLKIYYAPGSVSIDHDEAF